jgi:1,4-dihydroxy-2-naphthoate polyprenyltransferase
VYPFTGGSRIIQNGVLSPIQMRDFGTVLFMVTIVGGLGLMIEVGAGLLWIGVAGMLIGWAYSAPPLKLNSRGLGEVSVTFAFLLVVVGADFVQRQEWAGLPWLAGWPYALMVTNILYINQFPDRRADMEAGKRHWVVRLEPDQAVYGYAVILMVATVSLLGMLVENFLPNWASLALLAGLPASWAMLELRRQISRPGMLGTALRVSIISAHLFGILLATSFILEKVT